jgi:ubiquitin C-terminal hydrolase
VLFYGQEHCDTLAILSMKEDMSADKFSQLEQSQQLLSNRDLMAKNLQQLATNIRECEDYIDAVIVRNNT